MEQSPAKRKALQPEGTPPRSSLRSGLGASSRVRELRPVRVLFPETTQRYGAAVSGRLFAGGQLVLVRQRALTFHSSLIHSAQAAVEIPVEFGSCWGAFGANYDLLAEPVSSDSLDERYEILAVSPEGRVLLILDDSLVSSRTMETFDKSEVLRGGKVTSTAIAAPGVYLLGTSRGDVFRLRRTGRVLQAEQLQPPQAQDWFSALRETGQRLLLPAWQAALGSNQGAAGPSDDSRLAGSAVVKLIVVPNSPYLLECSSSGLTLWSNWDKGPKEQGVVWTLRLLALVEADLLTVREKARRLAYLDLMAREGDGEGADDPLAFGSVDAASLGQVSLVDFALLHDADSASWGTLLVLALVTPEGALSSSLWLFSLDLGGASPRGPPDITDRAFLAGGVSSRTFSSSVGGVTGASFSPDDCVAPSFSPCMYLLLPSWRVYLTWVDCSERVVAAQIDVKAMGAMSEELYDCFSSSREEGRTPSAGILTLNTGLAYSDVAAINTTACSARRGSASSVRQKVDGLVLLVGNDAGGRLVEAFPPLGTNSLRWAAHGPRFGLDPALSLGAGGGGGGAVLESLLLRLRALDDLERSGRGGLVGALSASSSAADGVSAGAVRDAISNVSLPHVLAAVTRAAQALVDVDWPRLAQNPALAHIALVRSLPQRQRRLARLVGVLAEAGLLHDESVRGAVQAVHEATLAACRLHAQFGALHEDASNSPCSFARAMGRSGLVVIENALRTHNATLYAESPSVQEQARENGLTELDVFFSRPSRLPLALQSVSASLRAAQKALEKEGLFFAGGVAVASLIHAALDGAAGAADEVFSEMVKAGGGRAGREQELVVSVFAADAASRAAVLSAWQTLLAASQTQANTWLPAGASPRDQQEQQQQAEMLVGLAHLSLQSYAAEAEREASRSGAAAGRAAGWVPGSTTHMPRGWQLEQHAAKSAVADTLLSLPDSLSRAALDLCARFHVAEGVMRAAVAFLPPPAASASASASLYPLAGTGAEAAHVEELLVSLLQRSGGVTVKAIAPSGQGLADHTLAEFVLLWIERHRPDLVSLALRLGQACPRAFNSFLAAPAPASASSSGATGLALRHHLAWMSAASSSSSSLGGDLSGLALTSEKAIAASRLASDAATAELLAAIGKIAAAAGGPALRPQLLHGQQALCLYSLRSRYLPPSSSSSSSSSSALQSELALLDAILAQVMAGRLEAVSQCFQDCMRLVTAAEAHGRATAADLSRAVLGLWAAALVCDDGLRALAGSYAQVGSEGGAGLTPDEEQARLQSSLTLELIEFVALSQLQENRTDFHQIDARVSPSLVPSSALVTWSALWATCDKSWAAPPTDRLKLLVESEAAQRIRDATRA